MRIKRAQYRVEQLPCTGVLPAVDDTVAVELSADGEYQYIDRESGTPIDDAERLLQLSAFDPNASSEGDIGRDLYGNAEEIQFDPTVGYYVGAYAGWVKDEAVRVESSSGGLTNWVLTELLRRDEVDGVIHLGVDPSDGTMFSYRISRGLAEVTRAAKSRYYPGELSRVLQEVADRPGRYAIVGIPTFIHEVRLLQQRSPIFRERILFTVGLICGHHKAATYAEYLGWRAGIDPQDLVSVDFRVKRLDAAANKYATRFTFRCEDEVCTRTVAQKDLGGSDWGLGFFKSAFSDLTQDVFNETADVVFGDAWQQPYVQDGRGTNVVIVRDPKLRALLEEGMQSGVIHLEGIAIDEVLASQRALVRQSVDELPYRFKLLQREGLVVPKIRRAARTRLTFARREIQRARLRLSRVSHDAFSEAKQVGKLEEFDALVARTMRRYRRAQRLAYLRNVLEGGPARAFEEVRRRLR